MSIISIIFGYVVYEFYTFDVTSAFVWSTWSLFWTKDM